MSSFQKTLFILSGVILVALNIVLGWLYYRERELREIVEWNENLEEEWVEPTYEIPEKAKEIKIFVSHGRLGSDEACERVFPLRRAITYEDIFEQKALEVLLEGISPVEEEQGYKSLIPKGVKIQSFLLENGIARIDFNDSMEQGVAGSCMVTAIRAQIEETLKQFGTVGSVVISVNGRVEDVLQP
jgi:hypothetical protein